MERMDSAAFEKISLADEHHHRYQLAAAVARGAVVDCACGIGYGSKILLTSAEVTSYRGIDPSTQSVAAAIEKYGGPRCSFEIGTLEENQVAARSIDTFVMLETLEHVLDPAHALAAVKAKLASGGLLIGSVPSADYEALCEQAYSPNPYHLHRFGLDELKSLLSDQFEVACFFSVEFVMGSLFRALEVEGGCVARAAAPSDFLPSAGTDQSRVLGSIMFVAGEAQAVASAAERLGAGPMFMGGRAKAWIDLQEVKPLYVALERTEEMIRERDAALRYAEDMINELREAFRNAEGTINELREAFRNAEAMIRERDKAIASQGRQLEERWEALQNAEAMIRERDKAIASQGRLLEERWVLVKTLEEGLRDRDIELATRAREIKQQTARIEELGRQKDQLLAAWPMRLARALGLVRIPSVDR